MGTGRYENDPRRISQTDMGVFQVLLITQPDRWTAASMYQATRLFASNMDAKMAQRYVEYSLDRTSSNGTSLDSTTLFSYHVFEMILMNTKNSTFIFTW